MEINYWKNQDLCERNIMELLLKWNKGKSNRFFLFQSIIWSYHNSKHRSGWNFFDFDMLAYVFTVDNFWEKTLGSEKDQYGPFRKSF